MKFFLLLFVILFSCTATLTAQSLYIKGRVADGENNQPLKGASVYINNSTRGTVTDENGEFILGPFEPGKYEVVASYVGYSALLYTAELKTNGYKISFVLERKEKSMREILILTSETRRKYLDIFKKNVLGFSYAAERCKIKNIEEALFTPGETKDEFLAYTGQELIIENPELGYTIHFELLDFYYNKATGATYFYGYTRYEDWGKNDKTKKRWLRRRKEAYEGSTVHFLRSLVKKELTKEGFTTYQLYQTAKAKTDSIRKSGGIRINAGEVSGMQIASRTTEDSMIHLYSDSGYRLYELKIKQGWRISYNRNTALKLEIQKNQMIMGQPPAGTISGLRLRNQEHESLILVNERGIILTPMRLYFDGMWAYERLANMLPEDYEPGK
ncbi:MAG: carboxypeptidase-like regulatory domain-containing protein [Chitinophagaceae bacterium]|nr:carboxypeptidase-like regulatory domain-containing protein [Chitinophagaceae bacterium]